MSFSFDLNEGFSGFTSSTPADGCTQCSICLSVCPTFNKSEDVNQSPMGRIRMIRALEAANAEGLALESLESCLGCYACEAVCPSQVNYRQLLDQGLSRLREQRQMPSITRLMLWLATKPALLRMGMQMLAVAEVFGIRSLLRGLGLFKAFGLTRAESLLGKVRYPESRPENRLHRPRYDQRVAMFTGCFTSVLEQKVQQASINILNALRIEVVIPASQVCCGALHRHNGDSQKALKMATQNIKAFNDNKTIAIVTTSSGCGAGLQEYSQWLGEEADSFTQPVRDISHYLAQILEHRRVIFNPLPQKVVMHTPCSLRHGEGQVEAVMTLLRKIPGLELHPLSGTPACCGAGGSQMLTQPEMADTLRDDILAEVIALEPDILVSSNLGCAMHLQAGLKQAGHDIQLQHPVQLLSQTMAVEFVSVRS